MHNILLLGLTEREEKELGEFMRRESPKKIDKVYEFMKAKCAEENIFQNCIVVTDSGRMMVQRVLGWDG